MNCILPQTKYETAAASVERLRAHATDVARRLHRAQNGEVFGKRRKVKPIEIDRLSRALDSACTCIELLTANGNYQLERAAAIDRVQLEIAATERARAAQEAARV